MLLAKLIYLKWGLWRYKSNWRYKLASSQPHTLPLWGLWRYKSWIEHRVNLILYLNEVSQAWAHALKAHTLVHKRLVAESIEALEIVLNHKVSKEEMQVWVCNLCVCMSVVYVRIYTSVRTYIHIRIYILHTCILLCVCYTVALNFNYFGIR